MNRLKNDNVAVRVVDVRRLIRGDLDDPDAVAIVESREIEGV